MHITSRIHIEDEDIRFECIRSCGPGGQNVNKVASAIRITHIPTGIQVVASTYRDQLQNKKQAFSVLRSKLEALEEERRQAELDAATGGQNVNKVASAIRVVHKPTGIMVVASTYRDQPQNKAQALAVLQAKLQQMEDERREKEIASASGGALEQGWGTQIRSYVFYDNRVKDHRTGHEVMNPQKVIDGDVGGFIDAELKRRRAERDAMQATG